MARSDAISRSGSDVSAYPRCATVAIAILVGEIVESPAGMVLLINDTGLIDDAGLEVMRCSTEVLGRPPGSRCIAVDPIAATTGRSSIPLSWTGRAGSA